MNMNIAVCAICAVLMVLGAAELVKLLVFWWTRPLTEGRLTLVVVPESPEDCEYTVRMAAERLRWLEIRGPRKLVCVNHSGDPEIDRICRYLLLQYPYLRVSKPDDLVYHCMEKG